MGSIACTSSDMHPFECGQDCIHCRQERTESHNPDKCCLCHYFDIQSEEDEKRFS